MLCYDRIDVSEEIKINKTSASKEWYLSLLVVFKSFNKILTMGVMIY